MILIDTVYQRVLAIANKEQRGYITPQEFNLFANQAQADIFEQYFYDINQHERRPKNATEYSNTVDLIDEKLNLFKERAVPASMSANGRFLLPSNIYRLGTLKYRENYIIDEVKEDELVYLSSSPLTTPTKKRPVYVRFRNINKQNVIQVYPLSISSAVSLTYVKSPDYAYWGYAVINGNALYDSTSTINFELHPSEEKNLVMKILALAGIMLKENGLYQSASTEEQKDIQQEKQ